MKPPSVRPKTSLLALPIENKVHQRMHGVSSPNRLKWPDFSRTILLQGINVRQFIHARAARLFSVSESMAWETYLVGEKMEPTYSSEANPRGPFSVIEMYVRSGITLAKAVPGNDQSRFRNRIPNMQRNTLRIEQLDFPTALEQCPINRSSLLMPTL